MFWFLVKFSDNLTLYNMWWSALVLCCYRRCFNYKSYTLFIVMEWSERDL